MKLLLIKPARAGERSGNDITLRRWAGILEDLGHQAVLGDCFDGQTCDLLVALHAYYSHDSIRRYRDHRPDDPLVVALGGTDLYRDLHVRPEALDSLRLATRIIVLQTKAIEPLPQELHGKVEVIYQSCAPVPRVRRPEGSPFQVCVTGHLRKIKDPLRTAEAVRLIDEKVEIRVVLLGRAMEERFEKMARAEAERNPRFEWRGEVPYEEARKILAASDLVSITSELEGSSNVLSEALASDVPAVSSRIPGIIGTLGEDYPGYFDVGDTAGLAVLLKRSATDPSFYATLERRCAAVAELVRPEREREAWRRLIEGLDLTSRAS